MALPHPHPTFDDHDTEINSFYDSGADSADEVTARLADDAAGMPPRGQESTLSCAACFSLVAPRAQPHAARRGQYRTVYLVDGAVRVDGVVEARERAAVSGGKRGRDGGGGGGGVPAVLPALHCAACGAHVGAVHDDESDGVPVYVLWDVLPGE